MRKPCSCEERHGFRNPPPGAWCEGAGGDLAEFEGAVISTANDTASTICSASADARPGEVFFDVCRHLHSDKCGRNRQRLGEGNRSSGIGVEARKRGMDLLG